MPFIAAHGLVATQYAQFGRAFFGLAHSLEYLVERLKDAYRHAPQQSRGDFTALDEIIGDYWRTIIDCKALYEKNSLYGIRGGPLANIEWNLVIQPEAAALQQRLLLQQTKIQIIVEPLRLDLLRQILTGIHQVQDTVNDVYTLVQGLVGQGATEQQQQLQLLWSCPVEIAQRFHAAAQGGSESQTGVAIRPLSEATDAFLYHFERSTENAQSVGAAEDADSLDREHLSLLKCAWLIEQIEGHADLGHAANRFYWRSYVRGLKLVRVCTIGLQRGQTNRSHGRNSPRSAGDSVLTTWLSLPGYGHGQTRSSSSGPQSSWGRFFLPLLRFQIS